MPRCFFCDSKIYRDETYYRLSDHVCHEDCFKDERDPEVIFSFFYEELDVRCDDEDDGNEEDDE